VTATDAVALCTPSNPTGRLFDPDPIRAVVEAAADYDASVVADEVYPALTPDRDPTGTAALSGHSEHVLAAGWRSKPPATPSWRTGWLACARAIIDEAPRIRESTTSCTSSVFQHAAIALTGTQRPGAAMQEAFRERRDYVGERVAGVAVPRPEGAFYAFLAPETDEASLPLARRLLREEGVVLAPGSESGAAGGGYLRLSFSSSLRPVGRGVRSAGRGVLKAGGDVSDGADRRRVGKREAGRRATADRFASITQSTPPVVPCPVINPRPGRGSSGRVRSPIWSPSADDGERSPDGLLDGSESPCRRRSGRSIGSLTASPTRSPGSRRSYRCSTSRAPRRTARKSERPPRVVRRRSPVRRTVEPVTALRYAVAFCIQGSW